MRSSLAITLLLAVSSVATATYCSCIGHEGTNNEPPFPAKDTNACCKEAGKPLVKDGLCDIGPSDGGDSKVDGLPWNCPNMRAFSKCCTYTNCAFTTAPCEKKFSDYSSQF